MKTSTFVIIIIIILIILGGAWWYYSMQPAPATNQTATPTETVTQTETASTTETSTTSTAPMTATVHLTASGFSPAQVTVANGGTVTFINDTTGGMWVASDEHPTPTDYDGTSRTTHCAAGYTGPTPFDQCGNGKTYSFTFTKVGSFTFHNHLRASETGSVTVQ